MWRAYETSHTEHQAETDEPEEDGAEHKVDVYKRQVLFPTPFFLPLHPLGC